jgi:hypothetical protein
MQRSVKIAGFIFSLQNEAKPCAQKPVLKIIGDNMLLGFFFSILLASGQGQILVGPYADRLLCDGDQYGMEMKGIETSRCSLLAITSEEYLAPSNLVWYQQVK